ncbi:hypothetical protein [Kineosporia sp. R_H_3]|uniref:hypothetical protein n=1 Tax=Kineosporia sp. R_H_3 TaxID=1961848 RepID=UPI000B4A72FB|nr:hypothetical protein [Kineosporia sp. R_H_3]
MTGQHYRAAATCPPPEAPGSTAWPRPVADAVPTPLIPMTSVPPSIDAARRVLAAALDSDLPADCIDADRFTVAEALAVLDDVTPPYPPVPLQTPIDARAARRQALGHLETALDEVSSVRDLTRIGLAAIVLRRGGGVVV